jgi:hypothetical protein
MSQYPDGAPPTPWQVECFQMLALHRRSSAAARALGVTHGTVRAGVEGFLHRAEVQHRRDFRAMTAPGRVAMGAGRRG